MAALPPPAPVPPAWYPDPWSPGLRWWDGTRWTAHAAIPFPPPVEERPPFATLPLTAALGALALTFMALIGARLTVGAVAGRDWPVFVYVLLGGTLAYGPLVGYAVFASRTWGTGDLRHDLGLRFHRSDLGWGPVTLMACYAGNTIVAIVVLATKIPFTSNTKGVRELPYDRGYVIAFLVLAVIAAPFVEELVFRGIVHRGLASVMNPWVAIAVQGALFGLAHVDPVRGSGNIGLVMVLSATGMMLGGAHYLTRRLPAGMIAHALFNTVALVVVLLT